MYQNNKLIVKKLSSVNISMLDKNISGVSQNQLDRLTIYPIENIEQQFPDPIGLNHYLLRRYDVLRNSLPESHDIIPLSDRAYCDWFTLLSRWSDIEESNQCLIGLIGWLETSWKFFF